MISRRWFLRETLFSFFLTRALSDLQGCSPSSPPTGWRTLKENTSRVVVVTQKGVGSRGPTRDAVVLGRMLDKGVSRLTGRSANDSWQMLFRAKETVGIKVNSLAGRRMSTNPALAFALAAKLNTFAGIPRGKIIIWDRDTGELKRAGYKPSTSASQIRCFGTNQPGVGYTSDLFTNGEVCGQLSRILTELTSVTVNMPVLKDHNLAGLSGSLKNMYGAISNPNKYHDNNCDPFVAQLNSLPEIRDRWRLTVADALQCQYEGGPGYHPSYVVPLHSIVLGVDPVAVDRVLLDMLDDVRASKGLPPLHKTKRPARHLETASGKPYSLGDSRLDRIRVEHIEVSV